MPTLFRAGVSKTESSVPTASVSQTGRGFLDSKKPSPQKIVLRRSIFFIIFTFITIELFFDALYILFRIPPLYFHFPVLLQNQLIPLYFGLFIFLNMLKVFYMLIVCLAWISCYYEIRKGEIKYSCGILSRKEKVYLCSFAQEVVYRQGILGRLCNFGSIEIYNPAIKERIVLDSVPNPAKYMEIIKTNLPENKSGAYIAI